MELVFYITSYSNVIAIAKAVGQTSKISKSS